ncbi:hypothetical protein ACFFK0_18770 [Paenibacillus chartarius]|uniref:Uncharacterized protein n=1 Tax=Paenibacillus chartarius TaxID=747481 RepID=A0ABV6DPA2_9BACL
MKPNLVPTENSFPTLCSSIVVYKDSTQIVSVLGGDVFLRRAAGDWQKATAGLPHQTFVNRLKLDGDRLFACTNKGLFLFDRDTWRSTDVNVPCYTYTSAHGYCFAATEYGIWCGAARTWAKTDISDQTVYDVMFCSQFIFFGHPHGISMYDRYTDQWAHFAVEHGVTSLAMKCGIVLGTTSRGELVQSDGHGGFQTVGLKHMFIYSLIRKGIALFACTDRGLFQIRLFQGRVTLFSIQVGYPVTDVDLIEDEIVMATLFQGIQSKKMIY